MKKIITVIATLVLGFILVACNNSSDTTIKVLATQIPHEQILKQAIPLLKEKGYTLEITVTDDYYVPTYPVF